LRPLIRTGAADAGGLARITLRDASGQPAADYEVDAATARPKLVREYVYAGGALAVERRYASDGTASEWYHHRDHLGSLRIVTDESGRKAEAHDWYPYGQEMASWTATGATTRKLYTGHERDAETGLDYMLARYYASSAGAFLTVDPLDASAKAADPLSWNRYAYVRGNPLNRVDPTGEADGDTSAGSNDRAVLADNAQGGAASLQDDLKKEQQESAPVYDKDHVKPAPPTPESVKIMEEIVKKGAASMHEVGGAYGLDKDGKQIVVEAQPGKTKPPCAKGAMTMDPLAALNPADIGRIVVLQGTFHSHSGLAVPSPGRPDWLCGYEQKPSAADKAFARAVGTGDQNYVFAMAAGKIYQYSTGNGDGHLVVNLAAGAR